MKKDRKKQAIPSLDELQAELVIVGLVLLAVFVIIPQFNKSKKGGK